MARKAVTPPRVPASQIADDPIRTRLIDVLALLFGCTRHPGNDENDKYISEELLGFAIQRVQDRTGLPYGTIRNAAQQFWL
jgi:hypothetical protein